jgi:uncharacterized protein YkwD
LLNPRPLRADTILMHGWRRIMPLGLVCALALTRCVPPDAASKPQAPRTTAAAAGRRSSAIAALERETHELVNRYRKAHGLARLALDERISEQARLHSVAMSKGAAPIGHQGFENRVRVLSKTMSFKRSAENVGFNEGFADPAVVAVRAWLESRTHRVNIEGPYELTGVGVARSSAGGFYFTQLFVGR